MNANARITPTKLAAALMMDVYHPFSVCVWFDADGDIQGMYQFDTKFCKPEIAFAEDTAEIWLLSNHHDGNMIPFEEDFINQKALGAHRLLIVSEDGGIEEIRIIREAG